MYGVVTIVEGEAGAKIRALWARLAAEHGSEITAGHSVPHLSYHVADDYDRAAVEALFGRVAATFGPFPASHFGVAAGALEEFAGVALPVARSPRLSQLHEALWDPCSVAATNVVQRYASELWFPAVALGGEPLFRKAPPLLQGWVREGLLGDGFLVNNLALIEEVPSGHEVVLRVGLNE